MTPQPAVLLVLPRADHVLAYGPLIEAIDGDHRLEAVVVGAPPLVGERRARWVPMALYLAKGVGPFGWLWFIVRRELAARRAIRQYAPALVVVPSDVSDATLAFVEAARARAIPVVYVQGTEVFPNFVAVNAATEAAAEGSRHGVVRTVLRRLASFLSALGVHTKLGGVDPIGSRSDAIVVTGEAQRQVLVAAGIESQRIHTLGAPFMDRLVRLRRAHDRRPAAGTVPSASSVLILTKHLVRLGLTDEMGQRRMIERILEGSESALSGWPIILKLHPMEHIEDYAWVHRRWPAAQIVSEGSAEELLLSCGLAISIGTSSPALAARFLGVPVVIIAGQERSLVDAHLDLFASHQVVRPDDDLPSALRQSVRAAAADRHSPDALADGRASMRIVSLFHTMLQLA